MTSGILPYQKIATIFFGLVLFASVLLPPVDAGLNIGNAKLLTDAAPGSVISFPIMISTDASDAPMDVLVDVMGFGQAPDMGYTPITPAEDTSQYSARPFITLDKPGVRVNSGATETVTATITIPAGAGAGGRYALISVHPGGQAQAVQTAYTIPVMITISGQPVTETGSILGIAAGGPYSVVTTFTNTGNHHYYNTINSLRVTDSSGRTVAEVSGPQTLFAIIPASTVQYETMLNTRISPGSYSVVSKVALPGGVLLAERTATVTFSDVSQTVQEAYSAPASSTTAYQTFAPGSSGVSGQGANIMFPGQGQAANTAEGAGIVPDAATGQYSSGSGTGAPATGSQGSAPGSAAGSGTTSVSNEKSTIRLTPKTEGILESPNKQISVTFPTGSVISDTDVTAQQVAASQIPPVPANVKPAVTCFQVHGLNGLLSKDATVTVKYTQGDLDAAGGDSSKLVLARWDEGESKWTIMPTTVDPKMYTLTVTTNRLSTWAVMVPVGPAPAKTTYAPGFGPLTTASLLVALILFAGRQRKKRSIHADADL